MLRNYLQTSVRNLLRNPFYAFINSAGFAVGIACSMLIMLWIYDEMTFDGFHPKLNRIHQVWINQTFNGKTDAMISVPGPAYEELKNAHSHISRTVLADWRSNPLLTVGETKIRKGAFHVTEEFLEVFQFPLIKGMRENVLDDPTSIVITESTAKALFNNEDPINKVIRVNNLSDLKVTGVLKDIPGNSSFQFDCLMAFNHLEQTQKEVKEVRASWDEYTFQVFVELKSANDKETVEGAIKDLIAKKNPSDIKREIFLYPMERWRLHSNFENGKESGGIIVYFQWTAEIAALILIMACINFMNLATARSEGRAREVGIRKVVGSGRRELVLQFLGESFIMTAISFAFALLLVELALPIFNQFVQKQLFIDFTSIRFWMATVFLVLFTSLISGSYPAFYLSAFQPVKVLKGKIKAGKEAASLRRVLVMVQFGVAIFLIVGTIVLYQQMQLLKGRDLGYDQEGLITVHSNGTINADFKIIKDELLQTDVVNAVSQSSNAIIRDGVSRFLSWPGKPADQHVEFLAIAAGYDYTKTMGIAMLEGRDFSADFKSDTAAIIVNQAALDIMGLQNPIGAQLELDGMKRELIGVMDNVLMGSPYQPIGPMLIVLLPNWSSVVSVRLSKTNDLQASLSKVESIFKKCNPDFPFEYSFVDVDFEKKFSRINLMNKLINLFSGLAILITGLGLLGLAAFTAEQRTKEIGIRKVMGATVGSLIILLSRDFSKLVLIAFAISSPIVWWVINDFIVNEYPIHVEISWWIMPLVGLGVLVFAIIIVSTQAFRAAKSNPVDSLRSE